MYVFKYNQMDYTIFWFMYAESIFYPWNESNLVLRYIFKCIPEFLSAGIVLRIFLIILL